MIVAQLFCDQDNKGFVVFASKTPLRSTLEASWSDQGCSGSLPGGLFGVPLANLTGLLVTKIWFFGGPGDVGGVSWFRMVSRGSFWVVFGLTFGVVRRCIFRSFEKVTLLVVLCTSLTPARYFSFQLNVSTTSWYLECVVCRTGIPETWVTCHANMSVCRVMLHASSTCVQAPWDFGYEALQNGPSRL